MPGYRSFRNRVKNRAQLIGNLIYTLDVSRMHICPLIMKPCSILFTPSNVPDTLKLSVIGSKINYRLKNKNASVHNTLYRLLTDCIFSRNSEDETSFHEHLLQERCI